MERITSHQVLDLMEAYQSVYAPQEDLNEDVIWEEVENWANSLVEEGYDLSEYTWEEMYEEYLSEKVSADPYGVSPGTKRVGGGAPVRPPSRGGSSDPYGASGAAGAPVRPRMSSDPYGVSPGTKRVGGVPAVRPPSRGGSSDPYGASGAARPSAAAPARPKIGTLPSSARQVTQYPQGVSTGVGGGNAGASRPSAAVPARPVARPSAAPAARPAAGAPNIARSTSQAPSTSPAATTGNPPLAPKPLPPIMGKPSLASQATELRAMQARSRQRQGLTQSFDPFDVVLGHLIDEGYADNEASALQIMTNMSEEWRESIIEGFKPTNYNTYQGKKYDQINKQSEKLRKSGKPGEASALHMVNRLQDEPSGREENVTKSKRNKMKPDARARRDAQRDEKEDRKGR